MAGYWGEVLTVAAEAAGVVGLVIDGGVRDTEAISGPQVSHLRSRHLDPRHHQGQRAGRGQADPARRLPRHAGDIVVADDDGVIVVPAARFEEAMEKSTEARGQGDRDDEQAARRHQLARADQS